MSWKMNSTTRTYKSTGLDFKRKKPIELTFQRKISRTSEGIFHCFKSDINSTTKGVVDTS